MPEFPLYEEGRGRAARRPGQPVTGNPLRGVSFPFAGMIDDVASAPKMSTEGVNAQAQAGRNMGAAVEGIGDILRKIEMRRLEAQNKLDVIRAQGKMDEALAGFERWKLETPEAADPRNWDGEWKRRLGMLNPFDEKMSNAAREEAEHAMEYFRSTSLQSVNRDAAKTTADLAKAEFASQMKRAADKGDTARVRAIAQKAGPNIIRGWETEDVAAYSDEQGKVLAKKAQQNSLYAAVVDDPEGMRKRLMEQRDGQFVNYPDMEAPLRESLDREADQRIRSAAADTLDSVIGDIESGAITTEADLEAAAQGLPERRRKSLKLSLLRRNDAERRIQLQRDVPKNFARYLDVAGEYDRARDPDGERYAAIVQAVHEALPEGDMRSQVLRPLREKFTGDFKLEEGDPVRQMITGVKNTMLRGGQFGDYRVPVTGSGGRPVMSSAGVPVMKNDPVKLGEAQARQGKMLQRLDGWMKANPREATDIDRVKDAMRRFATAAGDVPVIRATTPPVIRAEAEPEARSAADDLPEGEGGAYSPLLPDLTYDPLSPE